MLDQADEQLTPRNSVTMSTPNMRVRDIPASALRPPPSHPILKKPRGPQTNKPRPTARFVSPHVSEDEPENQEDIPSSGSTITPGLEMRAAVIKSPPKKKSSVAGRKYVASTGKRRPIIARRTSSQSAVGPADATSTRESVKSPRILPGVASPVKDCLPTIDNNVSSAPDPDGTPPRPSAKALGKRPAIPYTLPTNPKPAPVLQPPQKPVSSAENQHIVPTKPNPASVGQNPNKAVPSKETQLASHANKSAPVEPQMSSSLAETQATLPARPKSKPAPTEKTLQKPLPSHEDQSTLPTNQNTAPIQYPLQQSSGSKGTRKTLSATSIQQPPRERLSSPTNQIKAPTDYRSGAIVPSRDPLSPHKDIATKPIRETPQDFLLSRENRTTMPAKPKPEPIQLPPQKPLDLSESRKYIQQLPPELPSSHESRTTWPIKPIQQPPLSSYESWNSSLSLAKSPPQRKELEQITKQRSLVNLPSYPQVADESQTQAKSDASDLSDSSTAVGSVRATPNRSHSGFIRRERGFGQTLFTSATASTTNVEAQGTIIDQSGNTSPLPINAQGAVQRFDVNMPTSPTSILDSHLTPTPPSNAPPVPLGRTRSQLNILLDRENERIARKGWTRG